MRHAGGNSQGESSQGPSSLPQRIQILLEGKRLRIQTFSEAAVVALWKKAVDSARDAELSDLSSDGALRAAYDAVTGNEPRVLSHVALYQPSHKPVGRAENVLERIVERTRS